MPPMENREDGDLILTTGKSRSGKTEVTIRSVRGESRLLIWDFSRKDWPRENCELIDGLPALTRRLREVGAGSARISFRAGSLNSQEFGLWARCAFAWLQWAPATFVAEELADVVHSGKAPGGWGELVRAGLGYGATIHCLTQRIQETDKSIFGNATILRIFEVGTDDDARYLARATGLAQDQIAALNKLEYIEKNKVTSEISTLKLDFPA